MALTRPSAGMTRIRFKGHRATDQTGLPRYLSPAGGAPLGSAILFCELTQVSMPVEEMERVTGIEPAQPAWKAGTLPLSYTRFTMTLATPR